MNRIEFYSSLNKYKDIQEKSNNELKHYGIKDQKWGVRRWQNPDGTFNAEGKLRYFGKSNKSNSIENTEIGNPALAIFAAASAGLIAVGTLGATAEDAIHNAQVSKRIRKFEEHLATEQTDPKTGFKLKDNQNMTFKEDMKLVNMERKYNLFADAHQSTGYLSLYAAGKISETIHHEKRDYRENFTRNCMTCTTALDLRRRGYDVRSGSVDHGFLPSDLKKWYKNCEIKTGTSKDILNQLKSEPEGSYGNLMVTWAGGGGHSMFYRIEKGKVAIYDAQVANKISNVNNGFTSQLKFYFDGRENNTCYARLDNIEPNIEYLKHSNLIRWE